MTLSYEEATLEYAKRRFLFSHRYELDSEVVDAIWNELKHGDENFLRIQYINRKQEINHVDVNMTTAEFIFSIIKIAFFEKEKKLF